MRAVPRAPADPSVILDTDPVAIASRVSRPRADAAVSLGDFQLNEQTVMHAFSTLRDKATQRILSGAI